MKNRYGVKAFLAIAIMLCGQILAAAQTIETGKRSIGADPTRSSLVVAPPYPTYAGNLAAIGTSQSTVLSMFFGRDDIRFSHTWEGVGGVTRSNPGFAAMANEQERARIWAEFTSLSTTSQVNRSVEMSGHTCFKT